ncbi:SulP family inorganic anion transporter [Euzebya tangerina]|uniref:SulP family inorganic anion transporter n=1 Tax=Euzebya tangerina TaxID=591198 RepID=UPI0013C31427|nr:sulfate permease [Euzebya tangerina]
MHTEPRPTAPDDDTSSGTGWRGWSRETVRDDLLAGITVAAMLVPQAMAYALLAGLPPEVGLYASTIPLFVYALIGTSRQLSVGPVAIVSLVSATALAQVAEAGTAGYITAAAVLAVMVGVIHIVVGALRAGSLMRLLSHPVLVGFTAAVAVIIGTSQVRHVVGTTPERADSWIGTVAALVGSLTQVHLLTLVVGVAALALMIGVRAVRPGLPAALLAVIITTAASAALGLVERGVDVVGDIPAGLPPITIPDLGTLTELVGTLAPFAFTITLVAILEAVAVAKVYARQNRYDLDPNRELIALGAANLAGGLFGGYPLGGASSRTAVAADAGARTRLAGIVSGLTVLAVLIALTPLFEQLPQATLGAIVLVAVVGLVDRDAMRRIRQVSRQDAATMVGAFVATLLLGVDLGILVAIVGSLAVVAYRLMEPHVAVLGHLPDTGRWRDVERYDEASQAPGVTVVRFDTSLNYLNVEVMKEQIRRLLAQDPHALVLDLSSVNGIDTSALDTLDELMDEMDELGVAVHLATYQGPVTEILQRSHLLSRVAGLHDDVDTAARAAATGPQPPGATTDHVNARLAPGRSVPGRTVKRQRPAHPPASDRDSVPTA